MNAKQYEKAFSRERTAFEAEKVSEDDLLKWTVGRAAEAVRKGALSQLQKTTFLGGLPATHVGVVEVGQLRGDSGGTEIFVPMTVYVRLDRRFHFADETNETEESPES